MSKRKKAPTSAATLTGAEMGAGTGQATTSTHDSTTPAAERQSFRVADMLHPGAESAISRRDLMSLTGLSDRELRMKIEAERRQGVPILSDNVHGYFLPGDSAERDRCVKSLRRRAKEIERTAAAIERGGD